MKLTKPFRAYDFIVPFIVLFITLLVLATWIYWPGLNGNFILDDEPNLSTLSTLNNYLESEEHRHYASTRFWLYVSDGIASVLGRPVSLLSFALQAPNWPSNPWAFKYVNLMIHLLNGCLVLLVCLQITRLLNLNNFQTYSIPLLATAFWLLHPIHSGTVLYVIQRMTELSALFTLAGISIYLHGRSLIANHSVSIKGFIWMTAGILLGLILGILSKENAILLTVYVLVIEYTLFQTLSKSVSWKKWSYIFLYSPILFLVIYFISDFESRVLGGYQLRDFSLGQRLLTETRILWEYILKIIAPQPNNFSLFHDNFEISTSLFNPISTLLSTISLILLASSALYFRKQAAVYSFAVLWFLGGHLLESTILPLELYFDHRNYLPALGPLFAAAFYLLEVIVKTRKTSYKWLIAFFTLTFISFNSALTYSESTLWSNHHHQALTWLKEQPNSKRARLNAASTYLELGHFKQAISLVESISIDWPGDTGTYAQRLQLSCLIKSYNYSPSDKDIEHLRSSDFDRGALASLQAITELYENSSCLNPDYTEPQKFINALLVNEDFTRQYNEFHFILGRFYALQGNLNAAIRELDVSYKLKPNVYVAMHQAQWLASAHLYDDAILYLEKARSSIDNTILKKKLFSNVLNEWKKDILIDKDRSKQLNK